MSYQKQGGYQNVPHSEQQQQNSQMNSVDTTNPMSDPNQQRYGGQSQQNQQQSSAAYQMPSYHDYTTQNSNDNGHGRGYGSNVYNTNFGNYGPNVGSVDWWKYNRQSKRNRIIFSIAIGFCILFMISHPAGSEKRHHHASESTATNIVNSDSGSDEEKENNGIAGDGHHNNNDAAPPVNAVVLPANKDIKDNGNEKTGQKIETKVEPAALKRLKIAYLLTYPMSGTTYTMLLVSKTTNATLATNYDFNSYADKDKKPVPIYPPSSLNNNQEARVPGSPFWYTTYGSTTKPTNNVLTLSHCAGHCIYPCHPENYIQTEASFEETCRSIIDRSADGEGYEISITPKTDISKIIHLIRDPFSNIVSRFHEYLLEDNIKREDSKFSDNRVGFKAWCLEMDTNVELSNLDRESNLITYEIKELMKDVPCHSEFYKYVSWHNHVMEMAWNERYPILQVYYEDYASKSKEQQLAIQMAGFLEERIINTSNVIPLTMVVRSYRNYYTDEERLSAEKLVKAMALTTTWDVLERYFNEEKKEVQENAEGVDGDA